MMMKKMMKIEALNFTHEEIEEKYVKNTYEDISENFDDTRQYVWPSVKAYLNEISPENKILEVGSGNGRNLLYRPELDITGIDIVKNFIEMCRSKNCNVTFGDQRKIPFPDNSFNNVLSIAVLHHLVLASDRKNAISEIFRVLKKDGTAMIQVWKNTLSTSDSDKNRLVSWQNRRDNKTYQRYYYFYDFDEFYQLIDGFDTIKILKFYEERDNIICILQKI